MSRITFLIGNGFDRQLGLETGYDQFLRWYIDQPSENDNIEEYKIELKADKSSSWWSDAEIAMGDHLIKFDPNALGKYFERIRDFKLKLSNYLLSQMEKCDFSDEKVLGDAFTEFLLEFQKDILLKNKINNQFSRDNGITFSFINFNYTDTLVRLIKYAINTHEHGRLFEITDTVRGNRYGVIKYVLAVHGSINSSIIMGVNDDSQLSISQEKITSKLRRTLIKPETNNALGRSENNEAEHLIRISDTIAIYGLKLGETDKKWRDLLAEWLEIDGHSVVIFGHKKLDNINMLIPEDILDYVDEKQTDFLKKLYTNISQDRIEQLRDRVFVVDKTSFLDFQIIPKKQPAVIY